MRASILAALFSAAVLTLPAQAQEEEQTFQFTFNPAPSLNIKDGVCVQSPSGFTPYCIASGSSSGPGGSGGRSGGGGSKGGCGGTSY